MNEKYPDLGSDKIVRIKYSCTSEQKKALNIPVLQSDLYDMGAFYVADIEAESMVEIANRGLLSEESDPLVNLKKWLSEKCVKNADKVVELGEPIIAAALKSESIAENHGVLRPVSISVKNYRNYKEETFDFSDVSFCSINGVNGAGKSSLFMDAIGAQTVNYTQVGQYTTWYTSNQKWRFVKQSSGNYRIYPRSLSTGWLYYYAGDGLMKITTKGSIAEEFQLVYNSDDGTFSIKNVRNNKYVTLKELNSDKGTRLTLANYDAKSSAQRWYITPVDPPAGDTMTTTATYTQNEAFMTSSTDYRGVKTTYDYNTVDGTLKSVTENANEALNSDSRTTSYTYDSNTKALKSVSLADGDTVFTNTYTYDSAKRLSAIRHNGFDYTFACDEFGNTKTIKVGNRTLTTNNYNTRNGKLLSSTYGNGDTVQYSYDNYERLAQENRDGDITSYTYNLAGQLTEITDTTGKYTYYYDSIGRVTRMVYPDGGNLKPVYDKDNRLTAVHTNLGGTQRTTGYTYLLDGRLSQTALPTGKTVTYSYDPLARLSGSGIDGVLSSSYTYESPGEGKTTPLVSSVTTNGKETEYTYDAFGNILTITEDGVLQHSYTYDARNQLVGETSGTDSYVYSYDAGGNLVSVQKNGEVIKSYTYGDASWKDLLTAFNGQSITYDAIGNPLSYRGMTLSWAGGRRLASVSKEGLSASYVYNSDGIRTQKTVNGVTTNY